jgi:hypothetical protein
VSRERQAPQGRRGLRGLREFAERQALRVKLGQSAYVGRKDLPDQPEWPERTEPLAPLGQKGLQGHRARQAQQVLQDRRDQKGQKGLQVPPVELRTSRLDLTRQLDSQPTCCPVAAPSL